MRKATWSSRWAPVRSANTVLLVGLVAAGVVAAAYDRLALATVLVGAIVVASVLPAFQLLRRVSTVVDEVQLETWTARQLLLKEIRSQVTHASASTDQLDVGARRILAVVENARLAAADRHRELLAKIDASAREAGRYQQEQTREIEALLQLYHGFLPRAPMPPAGGWELNASGLLGLVSLIEQLQPATVLELGTGSSSIWVSYALQKSGGRLVSIDHTPQSVERTRTMLSRHGLDHVAEARHAPLQTLTIGGEETRWYAREAFTDLSEVDLLVANGPRSAGPGARRPALPALEPKLATSATIFLGYADGPEERSLILHWTEAFPGLRWERETVDRHAILQYARTPARDLTMSIPDL
jgi:predicted O-methyltransferase YrrM